MSIPLALSVEIVAPAGANAARWDSNSLDPGDRPSGIGFNTKRGDGFADGGCTLPRRIDGEYVDLGLLRELRFVGEDGSIAYEGRVTDLPRSMDDTHSIGVRAVGWMAHAKDRKFQEIYVDRDQSRWTGPSVQRKVNQPLLLHGSPSSGPTPGPGGAPSIETSLTGPWPGGAYAEAWYDSGGIPLGQLYTNWARSGTEVNASDPQWVWYAALSTDDIASAYDLSAPLRAPGPAPVTLTATTLDRAFALLQLGYTVAAGTAGQTYSIRWSDVAVYGTHGLTPRGSGPGGFYVSDVLKNIASRWAPKLDLSGVQDTSYTVGQIAFFDAVYPYDAFTLLNAYHLWSLSVWENKRLTYAPVDLSDWDWEVRLGDHGVELKLQGDSAEDLYNGIAVTFTDVLTGRKRRITPDQYPELKDPTVENPVNQATLTRWKELSLSFPVLTEAAVQLGRAALAENNAPKSPGTINVQGHIRDRAGHRQPVWKVRADDRIIVSNFVNDRPRLIVEVSYDHDAKTSSISVDGPAQRLDAVFDRIQTALAAENLGG